MTEGSTEVVYSWSGPPSVELRRRWRAGTPQHSLVLQGGRSGVVVVAESSVTGAVLLVVVRRDGREALELPRGFGEDIDGPPGAPGTAENAARRELLEETGWDAETLSVLGTVTPDSAVLPGAIDVVHASVRDVRPPRAVEDAAIVRVQWASRSELVEFVSSGAICDGHSLAALCYHLM